MRKLIIVAFIIAISGCGSTVESFIIKKAEDACKDHGGIYQVHTFMGMSTTCSDGTYFRISRE